LLIETSGQELNMALKLGDNAPDFTAQTTEGELSLYDWAGDDWVILFSHPADFTPVCTTELGQVAKLQDEFAKRNVKTIAVSVDSLEDHKKWIEDINETQDTEVNYPIIADPDREVANLYGMLHPNADTTFTVRSVFIIDPDRKVRLTLTYPAATGRNFNEILRVIDGLQLTDGYSVATPVNWEQGDDVVISPSITDEDELNEKFPGYREIRPWLRLTSQPAQSTNRSR
jgi:alkyl hydroperoxide reductase subunit AhpC